MGFNLGGFLIAFVNSFSCRNERSYKIRKNAKVDTMPIGSHTDCVSAGWGCEIICHLCYSILELEFAHAGHFLAFFKKI